MKDKTTKAVVFVLFVIAVVAVLQVVSGAVIMFLSNIILNWLDKKPMTLGVGIAISVLLTIVAAMFRRSSDKEK